MNSFLKYAVFIAIGGALAGFFGFREVESARLEGREATELDKIRQEYLERAPLARFMPDAARYEEEQRALWKWYFNALTRHDNEFPAARDVDRFMKELDARKAGKKVKDKEYEQYEKRYQQVRAFWDLMSSGKYMPLFTALDQGLRFDIYRLEKVSSGREPLVRLHFALYGIQRNWTEEAMNSGKGKIHRMRVNATFGDFKVEGRGEDGKAKLEMSSGGGEPFNVNHPERFIDVFPPGIVVGYYEIPRIPEVAELEMTFRIGTRSVVSGQESAGTFVWKMTDIPEALTLPAGQGWKDAGEKIIESE